MSDALILLWRERDHDILAEIDEEDFPIEAIEVIAKVLADNKHKYPVGHWKTVSVDDHLTHAYHHIKQEGGERYEGWPMTEENHLHHALTRLAMAVAVEKCSS